jgi:hypothetical protein
LGAFVGRDDVVATLLAEFPNLVEELAEESLVGLLHLEVACFRRYTQTQVEDGNRRELDHCYRIATAFLMDGDEAVKNAIYVSYLEHLNFDDGKRPRQWAKAAMPARLSAGYAEIVAYNASLARGRT